MFLFRGASFLKSYYLEATAGHPCQTHLESGHDLSISLGADKKPSQAQRKLKHKRPCHLPRSMAAVLNFLPQDV